MSGNFVTDSSPVVEDSVDFVREFSEDNVNIDRGDSNLEPSVVDFVRANQGEVQSQPCDVRIVQFNDNKSNQLYNVDSFSKNLLCSL